jgi:hypothetical protein
MSKDNTITTIAKDGLRYKSKQGGSPFGTSSSVGVMSCYKCGRHKARALGSFKKLLGQSMFVCGDCKPIPEKGEHQAQQVKQVSK